MNGLVHFTSCENRVDRPVSMCGIFVSRLELHRLRMSSSVGPSFKIGMIFYLYLPPFHFKVIFLYFLLFFRKVCLCCIVRCMWNLCRRMKDSLYFRCRKEGGKLPLLSYFSPPHLQGNQTLVSSSLIGVIPLFETSFSTVISFFSTYLSLRYFI